MFYSQYYFHCHLLAFGLRKIHFVGGLTKTQHSPYIPT